MRFLEISVAAPDLLESLHFYRTLGFTELLTTDAWQHGYAVVSDGTVAIGLHDKAFSREYATLVLSDLQRTALQLGDSPHLEEMRVDQDTFNALRLSDDDTHGLMLVEARTFSPHSDVTPGSLFGQLIEYTLPVRDALRSAQFWAPWAQQSLGLLEQPRMHMRLGLCGLPLGLSELASGRRPMLSYRTDDLAALGIALDRSGHPLQRCTIGIEGCHGLVTSPENLQFAVFGGDFLGA